MVDDFMARASRLFQEEAVLSVSELTGMIKELLEGVFPRLGVVGEVADLSVSKSGHCYLTLKDENSQLPAVIWRSCFQKISFDLHDGLQVFCRGRLTVYPPHGRYQFMIDSLEPAGWGALELAFRQLKERMAREGLFEAGRKRPLPRFPRIIAVITSPTGAAIHDFLTALKSRFSATDVLIVPVPVQGEQAAEEIATAFRVVNQIPRPIDVIVLTRGGGGTEDLWAFNTELVVRAIAASRIPVVSAVGHEIDVTLADLVADVRALTPTDAANRVVPSRQEILEILEKTAVRLQSSMELRFRAARASLQGVTMHPFFRRPQDWLYTRAQRLDEWDRRLDEAGDRAMERFQQRLQQHVVRLESLSPLAVLARGYSMTFTHPEGKLVLDAAQLTPGDSIATRFSRGSAVSRVESMSQ